MTSSVELKMAEMASDMFSHIVSRQKTQAEDPKETSSSVSQVLSTLAPVFIVAMILFLLFLLLRTRFARK